jgi:hypothetical protein
MSFEKISASTGKGTIRFSETTENLFNEAKLLSSFRSRTILGPDGKNAFDQYAMTESERSFFLNSLQYVVVEVFSELAKIANGVVDSVFIDEGSTNAESGFSLTDNEAYDNNILTIIDKRIRKCMVLYCLADWWSHSGQDVIAQSYNLQYFECLRVMKDKAWVLIKPLMN